MPSGPIADFVNGRILIQIDDAVTNDNFRTMVCVFAEAFGEYISVTNDVKKAFDLDTAEGDQLDQIGAMIGQPRSGYNDVDYRRNLNIQVSIIKSKLARDPVTGKIGNWNGTVNNILEIIRTFIGPGGAIVLQNLPPYSFKVTIPIVLTQLDTQILFQFICRAIYAAVLGFTIFVEPGANLWDSDHGVVVNRGSWGAAIGPAIQVWQFQVFPGPGFLDLTTEFNSNALPFVPFGPVEDLNDWAAWGGLTPFEFIEFDNTLGVAGIVGTVNWEYWDGATWTALTVVDGTTGFTAGPSAGQLVTWTAPLDWTAVSLNGESALYYVRAVVTTVWTTNPIYDQGTLGDPPQGIWDQGFDSALWAGVLTTISCPSNDNT